MIEYLVENIKYEFSYQDIREQYQSFCRMDDKQFIENINEAIHLACFICYIKEIPTYVCLSDRGIIHELIHIITGATDLGIHEVRNLFCETLKLS